MLRKITAIMLVAFALTLASCAVTPAPKEPDAPAVTEPAITEPDDLNRTTTLPFGTWAEDGVTFTNEWSGITFTRPDGWKCSYAGSGSDQVLGRHEDGTVATGIDVALYAQNPSVKLNIDLTYIYIDDTGAFFNGAEGVAKTFFDTSKNGILQLEEIMNNGVARDDIEFLEPTTATIAGEEYFVGPIYYGNDGKYVDHYLRELNDEYMISFKVTYTDESKAAVDDFLASIAAV
jgi:hypothetical protein